jgi:hypothetical protein
VAPGTLADLFDFQIRVRLPGEILSTNALETDDSGVMMWKLDPTDREPTRPEAVSQVGARIPLLGWLIAGMVVVAGATAWALSRRRRQGLGGTEGALSPPSP